MNKSPASSDYVKYPLSKPIRQSPPINVDDVYDVQWVRDRTILVTGGASGFGAGFVHRWAPHGATMIIADINAKGGEALAQEVRAQTGNPNVHFVHCDVTNWKSQLACFKKAVQLSPHGGIDVVVANAGVAGIDNFEEPKNLDDDDAPPPNLKAIQVNLVGVLYTAHLALYHLPRNPGSSESRPASDPSSTRDRHLLIMGSMASLGPMPAQVLYSTSKHGVVGLFRTLRSTAFMHGVRVNLVAPYCIDTPILPAAARAMIAGGGLGKAEDVVEAATRFVSDKRVCGRSLFVGPRIEIAQDPQGDFQLAYNVANAKNRKPGNIWEAYADDYEDSELFGRNITRLLNQVSQVRGWVGYLTDLILAIKFAFWPTQSSNPGPSSKKQN